MPWHFTTIKRSLYVAVLTKSHACSHGLLTPREEITFTAARPKIQSQSQSFMFGRSIFFLPHRPNFSDIFDLCLQWVSVVRASSATDCNKNKNLNFIGFSQALNELCWTIFSESWKGQTVDAAKGPCKFGAASWFGHKTKLKFLRSVRVDVNKM